MKTIRNLYCSNLIKFIIAVLAAVLVIVFVKCCCSSNLPKEIKLTPFDSLSNIQDVPSSHSVLSNPYYVLQRNDPLFNSESWPNCIQIFSAITNYSVCPSGDKTQDFMLEGAQKTGIWEPLEPETMIHLFRLFPNLGYVDIGANIGLWALPILTATQREIKLIAVEASQDNVRSLIAGLEKNQIPKDSYSVINRAIVDTIDENVTLSAAFRGLSKDVLPSSNAAIVGKIYDPHRQFDNGSIKVLSATIDSHILPVAKAMGMKSAILKIDIEGSECLALKAMSNFLKEIFVPCIAMEHNTAFQSEGCLDEIYKKLTTLSYVPYQVKDPGVLAIVNARDWRKWPWLTNILWMKM